MTDPAGTIYLHELRRRDLDDLGIPISVGFARYLAGDRGVWRPAATREVRAGPSNMRRAVPVYRVSDLPDALDGLDADQAETLRRSYVRVARVLRGKRGDT